jgi:hypothetical protein
MLRKSIVGVAIRLPIRLKKPPVHGESTPLQHMCAVSVLQSSSAGVAVRVMIFRYVLAILDNVLDIICDRIIQMDDLDIKDDYMEDDDDE